MSAGKINIKSTEFRRGFYRGLGAPVSFFEPLSYRRTMLIDSSVRAAWAAVDAALIRSLNNEQTKIGKTTGKDKRQSDRVSAG